MAITTVHNELIAENAISGTLIADNAITATHIATNAVSGVIVADNAITTVHIAENNVTSTSIVANAITSTQLADNAVIANKIPDGILTNTHLNSAVISSQSAVTAVSGDYVLIGDTSDSNNLKKALVSDFGVSGIDSSADATAITIDSSERVGIGTASPTTPLHVESSTVNLNTLFIKNTAGTGVNYGLEIKAGTNATDHALQVLSAAGTSLLRVTGAGKVGIGTTSPAYTLDINGGYKFNGKAELTDSAYWVGAATYGFRFNSNNDVYNNVIMYDSGNTYFRGNVGLGMADPDCKLEVGGTDAMSVPSGTTAQRPTARNGMMRYNTTNSEMEAYEDGEWVKLQTTTATRYRYARYRVSTSLVSHHPRFARVWVTDSSGAKYIANTATSDNCSDSGTVPSDGTSYSYDLGSGNSAIWVGLGLYSSYEGGNRSATVYLDGSNDNSSWTAIGSVAAETQAQCGELDFTVS